MNTSFKSFIVFAIVKLPDTFLNLLFSVYFSTLGAKNPNSRLNFVDLENGPIQLEEIFIIEGREP